MTDAIRLTVEVGKRVYHTENKNPNRNGKSYSKTATTQWPASSESINRNESFPGSGTRSFTVNLSKTQLSPEAERWNWEETKPLRSTSTLVFEQISEVKGTPGAKPAAKAPQQPAKGPPKPPAPAKPPGAAPAQAKPPAAAPKPPDGATPERTPAAKTVESKTSEPKPPSAIKSEESEGTEGKSAVGKRSKKKKGPKTNQEAITLEKMKKKKTQQPRPCKCGKAKDVTLLLKDLCECDTLNLRRINLVKLFQDYQKENRVGNPLPYLTDSLIVTKNRMARPQIKEKVEWTPIPRKGKKGVQFKKPDDREPKPRQPPRQRSPKGDDEPKKKVEVTVKYAEESLVTLFKNTSKRESMFNLTEEQLEKLNSD